MVKVEKHYLFDGPGGKRDFKALFEGRRQLVIYHFISTRSGTRAARTAHGTSTR